MASVSKVALALPPIERCLLKVYSHSLPLLPLPLSFTLLQKRKKKKKKKRTKAAKERSVHPSGSGILTGFPFDTAVGVCPKIEFGIPSRSTPTKLKQERKVKKKKERGFDSPFFPLFSPPFVLLLY